MSKAASNGPPNAFENVKKAFALQRARDLAENAKSALLKNKEISRLKGKNAELEKQDSGKARFKSLVFDSLPVNLQDKH